jgi:hypothetical protein
VLRDTLHLTRYAELVFLYPMEFAGHIVHSGASRARNFDALFFMLDGPDAVSIRSALGHVTPKLCFCIWWYLRVTQNIPVHLGHETSTHYFLCSRGPGAVSIKSARGTHYAKLVFLYPMRSTGHAVHSGASTT